MYTSNSLEFLKIINFLDDVHLVFLVGSVFYFEKHEQYLRVKELYYYTPSNKTNFQSNICVIFEDFEAGFWRLMKIPFLDSDSRDLQVENLKNLAHLMLSILQKVNFPTSLKVVVQFKFGCLSPKSFIKIMTSFVNGILTDPIFGAEMVIFQLEPMFKKYSGDLPSSIFEQSEVIVRLLLLRYYSFLIIDHEYLKIDVSRLRPSFLARIVVAKHHANINELYCLLQFDDKLFLYGINDLFSYYFRPIGGVSFIIDFINYSHDFPVIPDNRKDLQWKFKAYQKLKNFYLENIDKMK
jgi:hypothetical protein